MTQQSETKATDLYLDLLKGVLTRSVLEDSDHILGANTAGRTDAKGRAMTFVADVLDRRGLELVRKLPFDSAAREVGRDWPNRAESMIGLRRMDNLRYCIESVLQDEVPGDLIETGVWRGGAAIYMRAVLVANGAQERDVWLADSFQGLPKPDPHRYPADAGDEHFTHHALRVGVDQVKHNFRRFGLLDEHVRFLEGWFEDTLSEAPIEQLAVLRLDGDMYASTMQAIEALYPKLSPGGYCIVDDYGAIPACEQAISDYRSAHGITDEIVMIDWTGAYWRKG